MTSFCLSLVCPFYLRAFFLRSSWYCKLLSSTGLIEFYTFWYFYFHSVQNILFPLRLPLRTRNYLEVCLISKCLEIFLLLFCHWFLVWSHCGQRAHFCMVLVLLNVFRFIYEKNVLLLVGGMFCKCWVIVFFSSSTSSMIF